MTLTTRTISIFMALICLSGCSAPEKRLSVENPDDLKVIDLPMELADLAGVHNRVLNIMIEFQQTTNDGKLFKDQSEYRQLQRSAALGSMAKFKMLAAELRSREYSRTGIGVCDELLRMIDAFSRSLQLEMEFKSEYGQFDERSRGTLSNSISETFREGMESSKLILTSHVPLEFRKAYAYTASHRKVSPMLD